MTNVEELSPATVKSNLRCDLERLNDQNHRGVRSCDYRRFFGASATRSYRERRRHNVQSLSPPAEPTSNPCQAIDTVAINQSLASSLADLDFSVPGH
jgi:hypothetical protein